MTGKKWMIVLTEKQYEKIKDVAADTGLKGSDIAREALEVCLNNRDFIKGLADAQLKMELQKLEAKRLEIEEAEQALKRKLKQEKVLV